MGVIRGLYVASVLSLGLLAGCAPPTPKPRFDPNIKLGSHVKDLLQLLDSPFLIEESMTSFPKVTRRDLEKLTNEHCYLYILDFPAIRSYTVLEVRDKKIVEIQQIPQELLKEGDIEKSDFEGRNRFKRKTVLEFLDAYKIEEPIYKSSYNNTSSETPLEEVVTRNAKGFSGILGDVEVESNGSIYGQQLYFRNGILVQMRANAYVSPTMR